MGVGGSEMYACIRVGVCMCVCVVGAHVYRGMLSCGVPLALGFFLSHPPA